MAIRIVLLVVTLLSGLSGPIAVQDVNGHTVRPLEGAHRKGTCLIFIAHDCPVSNSYAPEIGRIVRTYSGKGIAFYVVYVEPDIAAADARHHAKAYGFPCPALMDPKHLLVKAAGAAITPEAAIFGRDGKPLYLGRIDDLYIDFGKQRYTATRHDLRLALDAVTAGKSVRGPAGNPVGCDIPR